MKIVIFWFRRDLRLEDNVGLRLALNSGLPVLAIYIVDDETTSDLEGDDPRVTFIYKNLKDIHAQIRKHGGSLNVLKGKPTHIFKSLIKQYEVKGVYANTEYEPYCLKRDDELKNALFTKGILLNLSKDHVIFEKNEILKQDGTPYTVYTAYKNKWLKIFAERPAHINQATESLAFLQQDFQFPHISYIGFSQSSISVKNYNLQILHNYGLKRNFPADNATSYLGPHLRYGTVNIREIVEHVKERDETFLNELIWREFFTQILFHFPRVVSQNFKIKYDSVLWRNDESEFERWCSGDTGYPIVDAGMRQLNQTGYMHNRVRMIVAGFLCKNLLIDWKWGEAYFANKLLDYDLSSNNGNWQWAAGTGCDAAPYFRVFNPTLQLNKFDPDRIYVKKWVPEHDKSSYCEPMVDYSYTRKRALMVYREALSNHSL